MSFSLFFSLCGFAFYRIFLRIPSFFFGSPNFFCETINQLQIKFVCTNTLNLEIFTLEDAHYETFQIPQINNTDWLSREFLMHQTVYSPSLLPINNEVLEDVGLQVDRVDAARGWGFTYRIFAERPLQGYVLRRSRNRWSTQRDVTVCNGKYIELAFSRVQWWAFVTMLLNCRPLLSSDSTVLKRTQLVQPVR
jgi:hypothetical protein